MKNIFKFACIASVLFLTACQTEQQSTNNTSAQATQAVEWLYVVDAPHAKVTQAKSGQYQLSLYQVNDVRAFSDRPARKVETISLKTFVQDWSKGTNNFKTDHPNAAVSSILDPHKHATLSDELIILTDPQYDPKKHILTFTIKKLSNQALLTGQDLQFTTLFIDNNVNMFGPGGAAYM